jgi:Leucine-rich repeat (LRR) protein
MCRLERIDLLGISEDEEITFNGNQTLKDSVNLIWFISPAMEFIPDKILSEFKNVRKLRIFRSNFPILDRNFFRHESFKNIKYFECDYCLIREIKDDAFQSLESLEELYLHYNNLVILNTKMLKSNKRLRRVNFDNNQIKRIEPTFFDGLKNLEQVSLERNDCANRHYTKEKFHTMRAELGQCYSNWNVAGNFEPTLTMDQYFRNQQELLENTITKIFILALCLTCLVIFSLIGLVFLSYKSNLRKKFFSRSEELNVSFSNQMHQ